MQISQEAGKVVSYSHLINNFPHFFCVIHIVKSFRVVNEANSFFNSIAFYMIQQMLGIYSLVPLPFLNPAVHLEFLSLHTVEA